MRILSDFTRLFESLRDRGSTKENSCNRSTLGLAMSLLLALPLVAHDYGFPPEKGSLDLPQRIGERTHTPQFQLALAALVPPTEQKEMGAGKVPGALGYSGKDRARRRFQNPLAPSERVLQLDVPYGGAIIEQVYPGSPAEAAGVRSGDVVMWQKGHRICKWRDMLPVSAGEHVELVVARGGVVRTFNLMARERDQVFRFNQVFGQAFDELRRKRSEEVKQLEETFQQIPPRSSDQKQRRDARKKLAEKYTKELRKLCDRVRERNSDANIDRICGVNYIRSKKWKEAIQSFRSADARILAPDVLYGLTHSLYNSNKKKRQEIQSAWDRTTQLLNSRERDRSHIRRIADERGRNQFRTSFPDQSSKTAREQYLALLKQEAGCQQVSPSAPAVETLLSLGVSLEESNHHSEAFHFYREALSLWETETPWRESMKIRSKILEVVGEMNEAPAMPDSAKQHSENARREIENAKKIGDLGNSVTEFRQALLDAPWWAGGYYNLAILLAQVGRYDEALELMDLYLQHAERMGKPEEARRKIAELRAQKREYEALQALQGDWNTHLGTYKVSLRGRAFRASGVNQEGCKTTFRGTILGRAVLGDITVPKCKQKKIACVMPGQSVPFEGKISSNYRSISMNFESSQYHFRYESGLAGLIGGYPCLSVRYLGTKQETMYLTR